ncbi:cyclase family protein [Franzmannia qiaohouensis]|uniref:Cyclase family protein n=1 Tax=Franzmannia qiaohouensis TaxID=1329370 RepID=A0ABU1H8K1_9GAMM|nr:cyclase family protein [Halomonas qiaohouensis]MDR5903787.1 cyclase family protein [Halomonas qiaohouensis]
MQNNRSNLTVAMGVVAAGLTLATQTAVAQPSMETLQRDAPSNWGKWGEADQVGALNYLGDAEVLEAVGAVRSGKTFTLQVPMTSGDGPVFPGRIPTQHYMSQDEGLYSSGKADPLAGGVKYSDDVVFMYLQGTTHVDGLAHGWYGDQVYGGESAQSTIHGHAHGDVGAIGEKGIVGRGVLLDVGRHMGSGEHHRLAPDTCIHLDDLKATADAQGTTINPRDILVIRTGSIARYWDEEPDAAWDAMTEPGLCYSLELLQWIDELEIPAIASDNLAIEKVAQEIDGETFVIPLHGALMRDMGVVLTEIWWLDDLAEDSAEDGQYSFLLVAAPLKMMQGSGSPVNPVAIK